MPPSTPPPPSRSNQAVADTIELTEYLRKRFDEEKIYLLGESWGTILGVLTVQQRPDLYHALIGSGQMVSVTRDRPPASIAMCWPKAEQTGDSALAAKMRGYGEPPYADTPYANGFVMINYEAALQAVHATAVLHRDAAARSGVGPVRHPGSEYNLVEKVERATRTDRHVHGDVSAAPGAGLPPRCSRTWTCRCTCWIGRRSWPRAAIWRSSGSINSRRRSKRIFSFENAASRGRLRGVRGVPQDPARDDPAGDVRGSKAQSIRTPATSMARVCVSQHAADGRHPP